MTAVSLFPFPVASMPLISNSQPLDDLGYSDFLAQIHTKFRVRLEPRRTAELSLLKARRAPSTRQVLSRRPPGDVGHEKFSLIFSGPEDELLESAIHQFEHSQLGRFEMFISKIGAPGLADCRYEAVFNRPLPTASLRTWG
jgi:hypothetical protein